MALANQLPKTNRRMPAVIGATLDGGQVEIAALGSIAGNTDPENLAWEIGSIGSLSAPT